MPRNPDIARAGLRRAAIELFAENGFENTTAAQIAERAGVTERTFFRHFPDKREVLFDGQTILGDGLENAIGQAEATLGPMAVLRFAFAQVTPMLEANRPYSEPRMKIIAATPALQEREVAKHVALVRLVEQALVRRGVPAQQASLAAQVGMAVFSHALSGWFAEPGSRLATHLERAFVEMHGLTR